MYLLKTIFNKDRKEVSTEESFKRLYFLLNIRLKLLFCYNNIIMFNVIRIPTKYSRTIKRFSDKEKAELLGSLIDIGAGIPQVLNDDIVWDTISLIYGDWIRMESKNWVKPEKPLIRYSSEYVAPTTAGMSPPIVQDNTVQDNTIQDNNSKELTTEVAIVKTFWNSDINNIIEIIKTEVNTLWLIYKAWKQERNRAKNISDSKEFWKICDKANKTREDFVISIIQLSWMLDFWKWKIYNAESFYKHYANVYNEAVRLKADVKPKVRSFEEMAWITINK